MICFWFGANGVVGLEVEGDAVVSEVEVINPASGWLELSEDCTKEIIFTKNHLVSFLSYVFYTEVRDNKFAIFI